MVNDQRHDGLFLNNASILTKIKIFLDIFEHIFFENFYIFLKI